MADFGEHLPCDSSKISLHSGESASTYHNHYPEEWAQLHQEVVMEIGKEDEAVCFFRSGYTHSPGHMNLFWAGDQTVTWDQHYGIKSAVSWFIEYYYNLAFLKKKKKKRIFSGYRYAFWWIFRIFSYTL